MKTRIISALVGTVLLLVVLVCPWWVLGVVAAAAAAIATWELLHNTGIVKSTAFTVGSLVFAALEVLAIGRVVELDLHNYMLTPFLALLFALYDALPLLLVVIYVVFALIVSLCRRKAGVWKGFGLTAYATLGFAALAALRNSSDVFGLPYVLLPLVIAWMSDTGAYFVGSFLGKHKMAPVTSPKKSWEGFFGGWGISVGLTVVFGVICNACIGAATQVNVGLFAVLAVVLAPLSVVGDLLASLIKRRCGIKDYGNLMPGHGGVMDRFDSVVFIAPLVWIVLALCG